ncbi:MAG: YggU family protein [Deltaproteobacteria bacterium]|nr:MAG: YggU family protein [Deltaproteobacteria bacterium]
MPFVRRAADGVVWIFVHVQPKASRRAVTGLYGERLKIAVTAPPNDNKANREVERYIASLLGLGKKDVVIRSGLQSRQKTVAVRSALVSEVRQALNKYL